MMKKVPVTLRARRMSAIWLHHCDAPTLRADLPDVQIARIVALADRLARGDERVGNHPMVVKAIRTHSTGETDLVISRADAAQLRSSVVHLNFLKACRVSIVMDPEPKGDP